MIATGRFDYFDSRRMVEAAVELKHLDPEARAAMIARPPGRFEALGLFPAEPSHSDSTSNSRTAGYRSVDFGPLVMPSGWSGRPDRGLALNSRPLYTPSSASGLPRSTVRARSR